MSKFRLAGYEIAAYACASADMAARRGASSSNCTAMFANSPTSSSATARRAGAHHVARAEWPSRRRDALRHRFEQHQALRLRARGEYEYVRGRVAVEQRRNRDRDSRRSARAGRHRRGAGANVRSRGARAAAGLFPGAGSRTGPVSAGRGARRAPGRERGLSFGGDPGGTGARGDSPLGAAMPCLDSQRAGPGWTGSSIGRWTGSSRTGRHRLRARLQARSPG